MKLSPARERALVAQDVMFVSPTLNFAPLSVAMTIPELSAPLRSEGFHAGYQDYSLAYMDRKAFEAASCSKIIAMSVNTALMPYGLALADVFKAINPSVYIVLGGYHPTDAPTECFQSPSVDFVLRGEADLTLVELVRGLLLKRMSKESGALCSGLETRLFKIHLALQSKIWISCRSRILTSLIGGNTENPKRQVLSSHADALADVAIVLRAISGTTRYGRKVLGG